MAKTIRIMGALLIVLVAVACRPTDEATTDCLARTDVVDLDGTQGRFPDGTLTDGTGIDAVDASWASTSPYPVAYESEGIPEPETTSDDLCMVGGHVTNELDHATTTWLEWHSTAGVVVKRPDFQMLGTVFDNVGDGTRFSTIGAQNWTMRGVKMRQVHDDCVENDHMNNGLIDDSFFDGCFIFYSARGGTTWGVDGGANTVAITNSLVRMQPMTYTDRYDGQMGHGPIFKLAARAEYGRSPRLEIHNTIFRVDQEPNEGRLNVSGFDHDNDPTTPPQSYLDPADCSNNTMVWLGDGPFPDPLPACFTVTTDVAVWDEAVAEWEANHQ